MNSFCYNNSAVIFEAARQIYKERGQRLIVAEGHIYVHPEMECVARCKDDEEAEGILLEAGYAKQVSGINLIFDP